MKKDIIDTHAYLPGELAERLRDYAFYKRASQAEIIRRALDDYLPKLKKPGK